MIKYSAQTEAGDHSLHTEKISGLFDYNNSAKMHQINEMLCFHMNPPLLF